MAKQKINIWMIAAFVLGVLFLCSIVYISVNKYKQSRDAEKAEIFQEGTQYGYQFAVSQMIENSRECKPVDVIFQNETIQMIDTSCLTK